MYYLDRSGHLSLTMLASVRYGEQTRMAGMWWKPPSTMKKSSGGYGSATACRCARKQPHTEMSVIGERHRQGSAKSGRRVTYPESPASGHTDCVIEPLYIRTFSSDNAA